MSHKRILCRSENRRVSKTEGCSGSTAAEEEFTQIL
jgi:hypothetical protein